MGCGASSSRPSGDSPGRHSSTAMARFHNVVNQDEDVESKYELTQKFLGNGMSCNVREVVERCTGQRMAMKTVHLGQFDDWEQELIRAEVKILAILDHPNIIKLHDTYEDTKQQHLHMVLELCEGGHLVDRLHRCRGDPKRLREVTAREYIQKMLSAVHYCHLNRVTHRDIKLENFVFTDESESAELKMIDFGVSYRSARGGKGVYKDKQLTDEVGTPTFMAPEVFGEPSYTSACDLWSIGVICHMLVVGFPPFYHENEDTKIQLIIHAPLKMDHPFFAQVSSECKDFITKCLTKDPAKRITASQSLEHPWVRGKGASPELLSRPRRGSTAVDDQIVDSLHRFCHYNLIKKMALQVMAYSLKSNQLEEVRALFRELDKDQTGYITMEELKTALQGDPRFSEEEVGGIFQGVDWDHHGKIAYTEFLAATVQKSSMVTKEALKSTFRSLDRNRTGTIDQEDLAKVLGSSRNSEEVASLIQEADKDGSGALDFEEFCALMRGDSLATNRTSNASTASGTQEAAPAGEPAPAPPMSPPRPQDLALKHQSALNSHGSVKLGLLLVASVAVASHRDSSPKKASLALEKSGGVELSEEHMVPLTKVTSW